MEESSEQTTPIGQSPAFLAALAHASAVAALDRPVLICGERGAGKELLAARVHYLSPRWEAPFVKLNCAALSEDLLESELFGHEAGAFTSAQKRRLGRFERANKGALFLDEIATASPRIQEKLLRVIEYGEFERVGGEATLTTDVRIIAATNVDLKAAAKAGDFRPDLLDRLAFDVVFAPPLRERREDIPLLAAHFAARMAAEMNARFNGFKPDALAALLSHDWPGNVRELKNAAERSVFRALADGESGAIGRVVIDPFPPAAAPHAEPSPPQNWPRDLRAELDAVEKRMARDALAACNGSQKEAAEALSLTYDQMRGLVRKHGLARK
jgi:psp operon transcriptional activator